MQPFPYNVTVVAEQRHVELLAEAERLRWFSQPQANETAAEQAPLSLRWQECILSPERTVLLARWRTAAVDALGWTTLNQER